jgi:hypothetical protein
MLSGHCLNLMWPHKGGEMEGQTNGDTKVVGENNDYM